MNIFSLSSSGGFWNPITFVIALLVIGIITYLIYKQGGEDISPEMGSKPFLSGNPEISKEAHRVSGDNLYWGLFQSMEKYYSVMKKMHSGLIHDYVFWLLLTIVALFMIMIGGI